MNTTSCQSSLRLLFTSILYLFSGFIYAESVQPVSKGATILIIRRAEKPDGGTGLSPLGERRAQKYVDFFKTYSIGAHPLHLDALFAAKDSDPSSRPRLTLEPLAQSLSLPLNTEYKGKGFEELVQKLKSKEFTGKTVLICWRHGEIPGLLKAFGANHTLLLPDGKWPDEVFGWLVELHLDTAGSFQTVKIINENLMPSDTVNPPERVH